MAGSGIFSRVQCPNCNAFDGAHDVLCPGYKVPQETPKATKTMRVVLVNANWFDIPQPAEFSVVDYVMTIRACGYILNPRLYVPLDQIQSIFTYEGAKPPDGQMVFPENMTKQ